MSYGVLTWTRAISLSIAALSSPASASVFKRSLNAVDDPSSCPTKETKWLVEVGLRPG